MSTLLIERSEFYPARQQEAHREYFELGDVQGSDFLDFARKELAAGHVFTRPHKGLVRIREVTQLERGILAVVGFGNSGQAGGVIGANGTEFEITPEHAAVMDARLLLVAPADSRYLFTFHERYPGSAPGIACVAGLKAAWNGSGYGVTWKNRWVQDGDQFLAEADLKEFEIRRRRGGGPTSRSRVQHLGVMSYAATAERSKFFERSLKDKLLSDPQAAYDLFELEPLDEDETVLHLKRGDVTKTYVVERGNLPKVHISLGESLSDEDFVGACLQHLAGLVDVPWDRNWCSKIA